MTAAVIEGRIPDRDPALALVRTPDVGPCPTEIGRDHQRRDANRRDVQSAPDEGILMQQFTLTATVTAPHDVTLERVRGLLVDAGFGVLTEIDLSATLKAKVGVEIPPQVILGACRPALAHQALQTDARVATMLPCNVVVAAEGEDRTRVEVFDPAVMTSFSEGLGDVADEARERLSGMLRALAG